METQKRLERLAVSSDRFRLVLIEIFLFFLFCLLFIQFYRIQIIEGDKWTQCALAQHQTVLIESFKRGSFYSNVSIKKGHPDHKQPFVMDVMKFHIYIDPDSISDCFKEEVAAHLFHFLNFSEEEKSRKISEFYRKSRSRKIASWVESKTVDQIQTWWQNFSKKNKIVRNAIFFSKGYKRSYPFGSLLGQVLHTIQDQKDPETHQAFPTGGLELQFDKYLKGKVGKRQIFRSPSNSLDAGKILVSPEDGADVYLTINHTLQAIAEKELEKGVRAVNAKGGWAILMDPFSGEILALAQYPFFDPSQYRKYYNNKDLLEHTKVKAVTDSFEPGSIFKVMTTIICMLANDELIAKGEKPLFDPEKKLDTSSGHFPGRPFPLKDGRRHNFLNLSLAMQKSSNIYFARLVDRIIERLGSHWYRQKMLELGFGRKTNIEIPGENLGLVPSPGKLHPNKTLEWSKPTPYSLAIGHNILVNSIQLLRAVAIVANGGFLIEPTLLKKIEKKTSEGKEILFQRSDRKIKRILSKAQAERIAQAMKFATKLGGTSRRGDIYGYTEAGKSGTSEKIVQGKYSRKHYISSFIGFAPEKQPRFVAIISVDEPEVKYIPGIGKNYMGGVCAAPIFKAIGEKALRYLGVQPDDPFGYPYPDPRRNVVKSDMYYERKELVELYKQWNGHQ